MKARSYNYLTHLPPIRLARNSNPKKLYSMSSTGVTPSSSSSSTKKPRVNINPPPLPPIPPQLESTLIWKQGETISSTGSVLVKLAQSGYTREASQIIGVSRTASLVGRDSDGGLPELWDVMGKIKGKEGITRLMAVCITRGSLSPQRAKALIEDHNADVKATDDIGRTALHFATGSWMEQEPWGCEIASENTPLNSELIRVLLSKDPKGARREDNSVNLPLHCALISGTDSVETIKLLVESYKRSLKIVTQDGIPLHIALSYGASNDVIRYLINACPNSVHTRVGDDVIDDDDYDDDDDDDNDDDDEEDDDDDDDEEEEEDDDDDDDNEDDNHAAVDDANDGDPDAVPAFAGANEAAAVVDAIVAPIRRRLPLHLAFSPKISLDIIKLLNVDGYFENGDLLLHKACSSRAPYEVTSYIFDLFPEGARELDSKGRLCFHLACGGLSNNYDVIKMLFDYFPGAVKVIDPRFQCFPLHSACSAAFHDINVIKLLLDYFPEAIKVKDENGHLPLHLACKAYSHNLAVIKLLFDAYPDAINERCKDVVHSIMYDYDSGAGKLAIHLAATVNTTVKVIEFLFDAHRESIKAKDKEGYNPFHHICSGYKQQFHFRYSFGKMVFDRSDIVKFLIKAFPEGLKEKNKQGRLPMHLACGIHILPADHLQVIQILLEADPESVRVKDNRGWLPIHYACANDAPLATTQLLFNSFPEGLKEKDEDGNLPIHVCFGEFVFDDIPERFETIQFLINSYPESLMSRNEHGAIPLHWACSSGYERMPFNIFKLLIDSCPDSVKEKDKQGHIPFMYFEDENGPLPFDIKRLFRNGGYNAEEVIVDDGNDAILNVEGEVEEGREE